MKLSLLVLFFFLLFVHYCSSTGTVRTNNSDVAQTQSESVNEIKPGTNETTEAQDAQTTNEKKSDESIEVIASGDTVVGDTAYIDKNDAQATEEDKERLISEISTKEIVMATKTPTIIQKLGNSRHIVPQSEMKDMRLCPQSMFLRPDFPNPVILYAKSEPGSTVFSIELNKNYARYIELSVRGSKNDYLLVESMKDRDGKYLFHGLAWGHISLFATSTKSFGSLNTTNLYTYPNKDSRIEVQIGGSSVVKVEACLRDWLFVRNYNGASGWLSPKDNCPSMTSNCN